MSHFRNYIDECNIFISQEYVAFEKYVIDKSNTRLGLFISFHLTIIIIYNDILFFLRTNTVRYTELLREIL